MSFRNAGRFKRFLKVIKKQVIVIFVLALFFLFIGLFWLSMLIVLLSGLYFCALSIHAIRKNYFLYVPLLFLFIVCLSLLTRLFVLEVYTVPSESMENTLYPGDHIILSKLNYGPKLPSSPFEIPWVNLFFYSNKTALVKGKTGWWEYRRWSGFSTIKHDDVVVFKRGDDSDEFLVKRCVGLAGDTLSIENGLLYLNGKHVRENPNVKIPYLIETNKEFQFIKLADSLNIKYTKGDRKNERIFIYATLSTTDFRLLRRCNLKVVNRIIDGNRSFPMNESLNWTVDNMGPLIIPKKGLCIRLNLASYYLYENIIKQSECRVITLINGKFYLGNRQVVQYTFKNNYYFVMGDNRGDSNDSRFWGFVAEQDIQGRVLLGISSDRAI